MHFHHLDKIELSGNSVQFKGYQNLNKSKLFLFPSTILFQRRDVSKKRFSTQNRSNSNSYSAVSSPFIIALRELFSDIAALRVSQLIGICGAVSPLCR